MNLPWADSNFSTDSFHLGLLEGAWKELAWEGRSRKHSRGSAQQGWYREAAAHREEPLRAAQLPWGLVCAGLQQALGLNVLGTKHSPFSPQTPATGEQQTQKAKTGMGLWEPEPGTSWAWEGCERAHEGREKTEAEW